MNATNLTIPDLNRTILKRSVIRSVWEWPHARHEDRRVECGRCHEPASSNLATDHGRIYLILVIKKDSLCDRKAEGV